MNKKEKEQYFKDRFLRLYPNLAGLKIEVTETPDFITISSDGARIGIELTDLINGKKKGEKFSPAQRYSLEDKITLQARDIFIAKYAVPLNLSIAFKDHFQCAYNRIEEVANEISEFVFNQISEKDRNAYFRVTVDSKLPSICSYIQIGYLPTATEHIWYSGKAMFVPNPEITELENLIRLKEGKLVEYRKKCDLVYLLIIEGIVPYSWYDNFNEVNRHIYRTNFDKVIVLRNIANRLIELKTIPIEVKTTTPETTINKKNLANL